MSKKNIAHPGDSRFHWLDEQTGEQRSALWVNTSDDSRLDKFSYEVSEHIQDDIYSYSLLKSMYGFKMCESYDSIDDMPLRDDAFSSEHIGKHVLFAGCSMTWGTGLDKGERWIDMVYNHINSLNSHSGLFNVAQEGDGIQNQVGYIIEYCSKYGNPDTIFFNVPDFWRLLIKDKVFRVYSGEYSEYSQDAVANVVLSIGRHCYKMLEDFCKINNINLISISWDGVTNNVLKDFKTFIHIEKNYLERLIFKYDDRSEASMSARDGLHPGVATHKAWTEIVLDKLKQIV